MSVPDSSRKRVMRPPENPGFVVRIGLFDRLTARSTIRSGRWASMPGIISCRADLPSHSLASAVPLSSTKRSAGPMRLSADHAVDL